MSWFLERPKLIINPCINPPKRTLDARLVFIMKGMQKEPGHKTYILRVWPVDRDGQSALVAVLEDCQTNERQAFASLSELLAFLEANGQASPRRPIT